MNLQTFPDGVPMNRRGPYNPCAPSGDILPAVAGDLCICGTQSASEPGGSGGLIHGVGGGRYRNDIPAELPTLGVDPHQELLPAFSALQVLCRHRAALLRQEKGLDLTALWLCKMFAGAEKGAILAKALKAGDTTGAPALVADLARDYLEPAAAIRKRRRERERQIAKIAKTLPVWGLWAEGVRGVGALGFGLLVGECHGILGLDCGKPGVAKVWKRMGVAVILGDRQRKRIDPDLALLHGYSARRRSLLWVIGDAIVKQGAEYREFYLTEKARFVEREPDRPKAWAHVQAKRRMEKRLLRDLWRAWQSWRTNSSKEIAA